MRILPVAKDAYVYVAVLAVLFLLFFFLYKPLSIIILVMVLFVLFFFRDPKRKVPEESNIIVSPADGRVMSVEEIFEDTYIKGKAIKISIFLSVFNVHINRSPIKGMVKSIVYRPGKYLPAFKSHASDINEKNTIAIEGSNVQILVSQITGFIARRIVCWSKEGSALEKGERFGLIKFGSCTEIIVPDHIKIKIKLGDKVRGAETIIGVII